MFKALVLSQIRIVFSSLFRSSGTKKMNMAMKVGIGFLAVYVIGCIFMLFGMIGAASCLPLHQAGLDWFYFSLIGGISILLNIIGGIFASKTVLFDAKDNELLLSMPIPPFLILAGRMLSLLFLAYLWQIFVMLPFCAVYGIFVGFSLPAAFAVAVIFLVMPLISLTVNAFLGWLLAVATEKLPFRHLISILLYAGFFGLYFYGYSKINTYMQWMIRNGNSIADTVKRILFPLYHMGMAAGEGNPVSLLLFVICTLAPFAIMLGILSRSFFFLTADRKGRKRRKYKERDMIAGGVNRALLQKELRRLGSSSMYMLNTATGTVFMLILLVFAVIRRDMLMTYLEMLPSRFTPYVGGAAALVVACLASFNIMSAPSISLEGKNLWIARSLPVKPVRILMAKVNMHIVTGSVPVCITALVLNILLPMGAAARVLTFLLPLCFNGAVGFLGVIMNLRFPKLEWTNEAAVVKQGMAPFLTLFLSMFLIGAPAAGYVVLALAGLPWEFLMYVHCIVLLASSAGMYCYLKEGGSRRFMEL